MFKKSSLTPCFHSPNHKARCEFKVKVITNPLKLMAPPKYLRVKLHQLLTYPQQPENMSTWICSHVMLILGLAGTTWGTATSTLFVSTQDLVLSASEFNTPVWCRKTYISELNKTLNTSMQTVSGSLHPSPVNYLTPPPPRKHKTKH